MLLSDFNLKLTNSFSSIEEFAKIYRYDVRSDNWMLNMDRLKTFMSVKTAVLPCMLVMAGCAAQATAWTEKITTQKVELPTECTGWEKIDVKARTRYYMMKEDQRALVDIDSHNLRGKNLGCWDRAPVQ